MLDKPLKKEVNKESNSDIEEIDSNAFYQKCDLYFDEIINKVYYLYIFVIFLNTQKKKTFDQTNF